jgi:hypothetical protein
MDMNDTASTRTKREAHPRYPDRAAAPGACCTWPMESDTGYPRPPAWHPPALPGAVGAWGWVVTYTDSANGKELFASKRFWMWDPTVTAAEHEAQMFAWRWLWDRLLAPPDK